MALSVKGPAQRDAALAAVDRALDGAGLSAVRQVRKVGAPYVESWIEHESSRASLRYFPVFGLFVVGIALFLYRSLRTLLAILLALGTAVALAMGAGSLLGFSSTVVSALVPLTVMVTTVASLVYLHSRFVDQPAGVSNRRAQGLRPRQQVPDGDRLNRRRRARLRRPGGVADPPHSRDGPVDGRGAGALLAGGLHGPPGAAEGAALAHRPHRPGPQRALRPGGRRPARLRLPLAVGTALSCCRDIGPAAGNRGEPPRLEWFFSDITERYALEEELRRSRRMEAVGRLATEVAPALNDLLTSVERLYGRLQGMGAGGAAGRELADRAAKDASRARRLAHQLWMFSQKQERKPEVFDLNSQLKEQESILRRLTGEDIDLRLSLDPEPQRVAMVKQEFEQAVTTLVVIARDALPAGGNVALETGGVQVEGADEQWGDAAVPGTYVQLSVSALGLGPRAAASTSTLEDIIRRNGGFSRVLRGQESEISIQVLLPHQPGE